MRLEVSKRTLRSWKAKAKKDCNKRSGRPSYTIEEHRRALIKVAREMKRQGYPGSPAIACALKNVVPLRLVRLYAGKINLRRRIKAKEVREFNRVSTRVKLVNVIWSQDGTHLGRSKKKSIEAQIIKDRGSQKVICISTGKSAEGKNIVDMFEKAKTKRSLPLVWMTDNGSSYVNQNVKKYMEENKVIHLKSLPRVPEHNGSAERMMCELKKASLLGKKAILDDENTAHEELVQNVLKLNENRKRMSLGFKTSNEIDDEMLIKDVLIERDLLYAEYSKEIESLKSQFVGRELRLQEREMVMCLLEKYELIKRTRGGKDYVA